MRTSRTYAPSCRTRGLAHLGIGVGTGDEKALDAALQAVNSPLLDTTIHGARAVLLNVCGNEDLGLLEVSEAAEAIGSLIAPDAELIFGATFDKDMGDEVRITVMRHRLRPHAGGARRHGAGDGGAGSPSSK